MHNDIRIPVHGVHACSCQLQAFGFLLPPNTLQLRLKACSQCHPFNLPTSPCYFRGSKFIKFQEARIQENSDEVPEGATPRTMSVHLRGDITRTLKAGNHVTLAGVFLPEPFTGWKAFRWADGGVAAACDVICTGRCM